jgi:REP element-mobilizing transposase RayT
VIVVPSPPRDQSPGFHHIWCRGNNKRDIVIDDYDRTALLRHMLAAVDLCGWRVAAYCLMNNHYHLVIEIDERGMSRGFCRLNTGYATAFNGRYGRINHLFGRRYGSEPLPDEASVLQTCRYVVLNPVRAGLVRRPEDYRWSSYRATIGVDYAELPLAARPLLGPFSRDLRRAQALFAEFVTGIDPNGH